MLRDEVRKKSITAASSQGGRVRDVDDDLGTLERLLQSLPGERVDPGVGRRRKRVVARLAELLDELRADKSAPADDDDLHLLSFRGMDPTRPLAAGFTPSRIAAEGSGSNPPTRQRGSLVGWQPTRVAVNWRRRALGVASGPASHETGHVLRGRQAECDVLDRLLRAVRTGQSQILVVRGEPGVGKSALLEYVIGRASGCRVSRAAGVEYEMELAYAGLHQLCAPMLDLRKRLPEPQRDALETAFGLSAKTTPDRFVVGLAVLGLLSEAAEEQPLLCVIDDVQWLDRASALTIAFVARRLLAEPVGLVFAVREPGEARELDGLPELRLGGLSSSDARALLDSAWPGHPDEAVLNRVVAEAHGNPLALLELPRALPPAQLAGGFGYPDVTPLANRIEQSFLSRLESLPDDTRRLLLMAAAEPVGDTALLWRAADGLGLGAEATGSAQTAGLIDLGARVRFRHPLVRSAVYRAARRSGAP